LDDYKIAKRLKERYQYLNNLNYRTAAESQEMKFLQLILVEEE